ncbi:MAG: hypothetical protein HN929_00905 [Chloroflexi bacterium]|jgi:hypothetical protein|nr:hypothetical protein [Chloroflexota bacterium]
MARMKYDPEYHKNLKVATTKGPLADVRGDRRRLECGVDVRTGLPCYILDRKQVISQEDVWALGVGYDKLPSVSNIRK